MGQVKHMFQVFRNVIYMLKPLYKYGKLYIVLSIVMSFVVLPINSLCSVLFTQNIVDAVANQASFSQIFTVIIKYLLILLSISVLQISFDILYKEKISFKIQQKIKEDIYTQILKTDYVFFDDPEFYNNYCWALNEYIAKINEAHQLFMSFLRSLSTIMMMASLICILGPWIVVITAIQLIITTIIQTKKNKINLGKREECMPIDRKLGYVHRVFYHRDYAADLRTTNIKDILLGMYHENTHIKERIIDMYAKKTIGFSYIHSTIAIIYNAFVLAYISYEIVVTKRISGIGKFSSLLAANNQLVNSLSALFGIYARADKLSLYAEKIKSFFNAESKIEINSSGLEITQDKPFSVKISNVNFFYTKSNFALKDINLEIKPGEKIAIVGANGAGKTTLMKLLLRLYDVNSGFISYNNVPIEKYNLKGLRKKVGIAFQNTIIYATTLANNVKLYGDIPDESLKDIISKCGLSDVLIKHSCDSSQEMTREFISDGIMLSTGEKQKLGLARIMANRFGLILLDEPSSTLDPISEYRLTQLLFSEANKTTSIIISHRLSVVRDAQCIYVMHDGRIVEKGTHSELMEFRGMYYEMYSKQSENYIKS